MRVFKPPALSPSACLSSPASPISLLLSPRKQKYKMGYEEETWPRPGLKEEGDPQAPLAHPKLRTSPSASFFYTFRSRPLFNLQTSDSVERGYGPQTDEESQAQEEKCPRSGSHPLSNVTTLRKIYSKGYLFQDKLPTDNTLFKC